MSKSPQEALELLRSHARLYGAFLKNEKHMEMADEWAAIVQEFLPKEKCDCLHNGCGALLDVCICPCHKKPEKCCKGFELDGVLFHECKEHRPYCAKDWPCLCIKKPDKPDNEGALQDVWNLDKWGTKDRTLVKHFEEEREWRKEIIGIVSSIIIPTETPQSSLKYQREWLEDLRRKFT